MKTLALKDLQLNLIFLKFNFIYIARNQKNSCLKVLLIVRYPTKTTEKDKMGPDYSRICM